MINRRTLLVTGAAALAAPARLHAATPLKVGFIYQSPRNDRGWTENHERARIAVEKHFGDRVSTTFVENIQGQADAERVIRQLAQSGNDLIISTSFSFMNPTIKVARQFPKVKFEHATGYERTPNLATYAARYYEGRDIMGLVAGKMTKTNTIGYIASFPIPGVLRGINAAFLAARRVNPKVEMKVIWISTWFDPGKEADAANALIQQGADVLMQHVNSPAPMRVAEEKGVRAFGLAVDMSEYGPKAHLTSMMFNWAPYYIRRIQAVLDGNWKSEDTWEGIGPGMIAFSPFASDIPADVIASVKARMAELSAGGRHPFAGPLNRQDGTRWLAEGASPTDGELLKVNFYVEGIGGALPK